MKVKRRKKIVHLLSAFQRLVQNTVERLKELESTSDRKGCGGKVSVATDTIKRIREKNSSQLGEEHGERGRHQRYLLKNIV